MLELSDILSSAAFPRWLILGPLPSRGEGPRCRPPGPERELDPNATYEGVAGPTRWRGWQQAPSQDAVVRVSEEPGPSGGGRVYASALVYCRRELTGTLLVGSTCPATAFVSGNPVALKPRADQGPGQETEARVTLRHGWNRILLKLQCESTVCAFAAGLTTAAGEPLPDVRVHTTLFGRNPDDASQAIETGPPASEWQRSGPDVVVYLPREGDWNDGDNEHFLVFPAPSGAGLLAMWTQGTVEAHGDNHIMLSRSADGITWSPPEWIVGCHPNSAEFQASWGFPVVARTGRLYCFYQKSPRGTRGGGTSNVMGGLSSDDEGRTWLPGPDIHVPTAPLNPREPDSGTHGFIVWQTPVRDRLGRWLAGYTGGGLGFMRFDNVAQGPDIADLEITWLPGKGPLVNLPRYVDTSHHCGEPSLVLLPDGRLFTTMRTTTGYIWYSVSTDDGASWRDPEVLRYRDEGKPVLHPLAPCPLYPLRDGRYLLLYHNNEYYAAKMAAGEELPAGMGIFTHRRPAFVALGEYRAQAHQPVWFSAPRKILDNDGVVVSAKTSNEIATYTSLTDFNGKQTLWYPDRKYYLLGKQITDGLLAGLRVE